MSYKQLINFDNYYIYDDGKIYSIKSKKFLKPYYINGYLKIDLYDNKTRKKYFIHRLVYETFNGSIPEGLQVDHINGIRDDNRLINLRLLTNKENSQNKHQLEQYKEIDKKRSLKEDKEKRKERRQKYYEEHKEEENRRNHEYYEEHKEDLKRKQRERYQNKKLNN